MSLKNPVTPPGIDPGTFGLVAQRLNHYATPGPMNCFCTVLIRTRATGYRGLDLEFGKVISNTQPECVCL